MSKFASLYSIETKKALKTKVLLVISIILFILLIVVTVSVEVIGAFGDAFMPDINEITSAQEGLDYYKAILEEFNTQEKAGTIKNPFWSNPRGQIESYVTYYQYLVDNNLSIEQAKPYSLSTLLSDVNTGIGYLRTMLTVITTFALLATVIVSAGNMVGEHKNGTLKMLLLRPVSRKAVFTAKWCGSMTLASVIYVGATMICMIYGLIRFKGAQGDMVMVSGNSAFLVNGASVFVMEFFQYFFKIFVYCQFTYFLGTIFKSKNVTLLIAFLMLFLGSLISTALGYIYIGFIDINYNLSFLTSLNVGASVYPGSTAYGSLIISFVYLAIFMAVNYISFDKREIN